MNKITCLCIALCLLLKVDSFANNEIVEKFDNSFVKPQRVRIHCITPTGYVRHLLLAFTPDNIATDNYDPGYDAQVYDNIPDDLNWIIEDGRYVIQGVGEFNTNKYYPLGMFLTNSGNVSISLAQLENFNEEIDVYIFDLELNSYSHLNQLDFEQNLEADTYLNRYFVTFSNNVHLEISNNYLL